MMMTMNIFPLLLTWLLVEAEELIPQVEVHVHAQRVFKYSFNPSMFRWSHGDLGGVVRYTYSYLPALEGLPDMPTWMKYKYSQRHKAGKFVLLSSTLFKFAEPLWYIQKTTFPSFSACPGLNRFPIWPETK